MLEIRKHFGMVDRVEWREQRLAFLEKWRNELKGERGFVIGNGPSLRGQDLDLIRGEPSLAANLIHLIYPETSWRPTFVSITDSLVWQKFWDRQPEIVSPILGDTRFPQPPHTVDYVPFPHISIFSKERLVLRSQGKPFSTDLSRGYFGGFTVTYFNLQLAIHLGLNPIYLLGVDHKYSEDQSLWRPRTRVAGNSVNHFHRDYRRPGELVKAAPLMAMETYYQVAHRVSRQRNRQIIDLTSAGALKAFPRRGLSEIL